jgi:hypothetical protein
MKMTIMENDFVRNVARDYEIGNPSVVQDYLGLSDLMREVAFAVYIEDSLSSVFSSVRQHRAVLNAHLNTVKALEQRGLIRRSGNWIARARIRQMMELHTLCTAVANGDPVHWRDGGLDVPVCGWYEHVPVTTVFDLATCEECRDIAHMSLAGMGDPRNVGRKI